VSATSNDTSTSNIVAATATERERLAAFDFQPRTRLVFGPGSISQLGTIAAELGFRRPLLVADHGLLEAGHVRIAERQLAAAHISAVPFHAFDVNPDTEMIEVGCAAARPHAVDAIIGLGGGSSMDCAKGINFVLTNGGRMEDYRGYNKATRPLLPMIGIPTTAGTGSEAQSYAVIADTTTHVKMACGDTKAAFRVAILDPELTLSQPVPVTATSGFDALVHAVETAVTTRRTPLSDCFAREAWRLLNEHYEMVLNHPDDIDARAAMQLGAFHAGLAIEQSMLGAAHACANPLTARYQVSHGVALAIVVPHIVRWNGGAAGRLYSRLLGDASDAGADDAADRLAARLRYLADRARLPSTLSSQGVGQSDLPQLADDAAVQWTGTFNPRPFTASDALEIYRCAF
jgi:alcohol dehydrogenase